ncbi:MAG: dolichyl-phosphate beta-glucosyltransferase [Patescibacteria group bacterium]
MNSMSSTNSMQKPWLSVVIPSYNERSNVELGVLDDTLSYLQRQKYTWELILTDDGSTDGTLDALMEYAKLHPHVRVLANSHQGKGPTVFVGMMAAEGALRLFTDFDQATPIQEIEKLLPFMEDKYDLVIGSREVQGAKREREPLHRHVMGKAFNIAVKMLTIQGIQDTQCGFKLFTKQATEKLFPMMYIYRPGAIRSDAFTGAFDVELLYLAKKCNMRIAEVPVFWKYRKTERVSPLKDSILMFLDLLRIRSADFLGKYPNT